MKAFVKYLLFVLCFVTLEAGAQESVSINAIDLDTNADRNKKKFLIYGSLILNLLQMRTLY